MNLKNDFNLIKDEIYAPKEKQWTSTDFLIVLVGMVAIVSAVAVLWRTT